jgi:hypothetical protein
MVKKKPAPPPDPITTLGAIERLAEMPDAIRQLVTAVKKVETAGLNRRALVLLLHDASRVPKKQINDVLDALPLLAERFLDG